MNQKTLDERIRHHLAASDPAVHITEQELAMSRERSLRAPGPQRQTLQTNTSRLAARRTHPPSSRCPLSGNGGGGSGLLR